VVVVRVVRVRVVVVAVEAPRMAQEMLSALD
jgi:hypothetical protein